MSRNQRSGNNSSSRQPEVEETLARPNLRHQGSYRSLLEEMRTNKSKSSLHTYLNETEVRDEIYSHDPKNLIILVGEHKRLIYYDTAMSKWSSSKFSPQSGYQGWLKYTSICSLDSSSFIMTGGCSI